jgi:3-phenylpropionate/cinnamic acid dioxygenase small subunit
VYSITPNPAPTAGLRPAAARHNISNIVIKVDGNKAVGRSYWVHYSNDNPQRKGVFDGFGHYEDELVKSNGQWLFTKRKIYNEGRDEWAYKGGKNPAW